MATISDLLFNVPALRNQSAPSSSYGRNITAASTTGSAPFDLIWAQRNREMQDMVRNANRSGEYWPSGRRGRRALRAGYQNLLDVILSQGRTDPRMLNENILGIQRGAESNAATTQEQLASMGLGASGVGQALAAAQMEGGNARVAQARAAEAAISEQRKRDDLRLLVDLIINPALMKRAQDLGLEQWLAQMNATASGGNAAALGQILGALSGLAGSAMSRGGNANG